MIRERCKGASRGWSLFPPIEVVLLPIAICASWLVSGDGLLSPRALSTYGFAFVAGSYLHFGVVAAVYGIWLRVTDRSRDRE